MTQVARQCVGPAAIQRLGIAAVKPMANKRWSGQSGYGQQYYSGDEFLRTFAVHFTLVASQNLSLPILSGKTPDGEKLLTKRIVGLVRFRSRIRHHDISP